MSTHYELHLPTDFYDEEVREGYRIPREMKEVWAVSLDIAVKLLNVCQRHGLKIWMDSGTLLGAVRHRGFIPWDDDIDFVMMRDDYDRLCRIADQEFQPPYFFQTTYSDPGIYRGHAQVRHSDTSAMTRWELGFKYNRGIPVDIFVLDGIPRNRFLLRAHRRVTMLLERIMRIYGDSLNIWYKDDGTRIVKYSKLAGKHIGLPRIFALYEWLFRLFPAKHSRQVSVGAYQYSYPHRVRLRKAYDTTIYLPFEGIMMPAPADTHEALRCYFGEDYMTPRRESSAHGQRYLNAHLPYAEATKNILERFELFDERLQLLYTEQD